MPEDIPAEADGGPESYESPETPAPDGGHASDGRGSPEFTDHLSEVLYRASLIGESAESEATVNFTSILLGFLASSTPLSRWFQDYVREAGIDVPGMSSYQRVDRKFLDDVARREPGPFKLLPSASAQKIFRAASAIPNLRGKSPSAEIGEGQVMAAYIYHCPPDHLGELSAWGFDRAVWSEAFLAHKRAELPEDVLATLTRLHRSAFGSEPRLHPAAAAAAPDVTPLHLDNPADADYLGRRGFAEALAVRLNRVWGECNRAGARAEARSSFVLHLHGPWGSGKTSLLKFLRRELQTPREADEARKWVVVEFNAWQHQRISPPWWPLLESVSRQAAAQLRGDFGERGRALRLRAREWWWRFSTGRKVYLLTALLAFALAALLYALTKSNFFGAGWAAVLKSAKSFVAYASVVIGVWSTVQHVSRSLLSGSARAAQTFLETAGDPMERVCAHFRELVGWAGHPVVIFIDDLDRCQPKYVVELLEGVQTLFSDPRVVYVVAADRRWLNTCFETTYQTFADAVKEPGRRLGSLFLEKAFELSVSVPRLSDEMRQVYWDYLVGGTRDDIERAIREKSAEVEREFAGTETEEQVFGRLREGARRGGGEAGGDPLRDQVMRGAAVRRLASRKVAASTEYFLKPFAALLEPNPRSMKRLVNTYSVLRDMALLAGVDVLGDIAQRRQLALWAIVSLRWPLLEEHLEAHPELIDAIRDGATREGARALFPDEHLLKLAESEEVRNVFRGGDTRAALERGAVCRIVGISTAQPTAASVA